jgi:hypothetical protein
VTALVALAIVATPVNAAPGGNGKSKVELSYELYSFDDGTFVVDYTVPGKGVGNMDLAVSHECVSDGQVVQAWTNRLYWSGKGADKAGHWNTQVQSGNECSAVVVDLDQPDSGALRLASSGYAEVSPPVHYVVQ